MERVKVVTLGPGGPGKVGEYLLLSAEEAQRGEKEGWARIIHPQPGMTQRVGAMTPKGRLETKDGGAARTRSNNSD